MTSARSNADVDPVTYGELLNEIKDRIRNARTGAVLAVNRALIRLYWEIGQEILRMRSDEGWGTGISVRLAADLRREFPDMTGLSRTNLHYMRVLAEAWPTADAAIVQQVVEQLPWGHNIVLLTKLESRDDRLWYARKAIEHGWSRAVFEAQIATSLRAREGKAISSFLDGVKLWRDGRSGRKLKAWRRPVPRVARSWQATRAGTTSSEPCSIALRGTRRRRMTCRG